MASPISHRRYPTEGVYRLRMIGYLDEVVFEYFDHLTLSVSVGPDQNAITTLTCQVPDEAALMGIINTLYDFGLKILSVERLSAEAS
jgi:hypothetical protein